MATFTLTVGKYYLTYTDLIKSIIEDSCADSNDSYPIGIQDTTPATPSTIFLLSSYTGNIKKTLHIKNVTTTDNAFYLEYLGADKTGSGPFSINIESVNDGDAISSLTFESSIVKNEITGVKTIAFDYAIEDIYGGIEEYTSTSISLNVTKCSTPQPPVVTNECTKYPFLCGGYSATSHFITVTVPPGSDLYLRLHTTFRGLGNFNFTMRRYEVSNCTEVGNSYNVVTGAIQDDPGDYKYVTYKVPPSITSLTFSPENVIHLEMHMCMLRMYGDKAPLDNVMIMNVDVLDAPGEAGNVIHTVTLSETRPGI